MSEDNNPSCYSLKIDTKEIFSYETWDDAFVKTSWNSKTAIPQIEIKDFRILEIIDQVATLSFAFEQKEQTGSPEYRDILGKGIIHLPTIESEIQLPWKHFYLHYDAETAQPYYTWMKSLNLGFEDYRWMFIKQISITIEGKIYRLIWYNSEANKESFGDNRPQFTLDNAQDAHAEFDAVRLNIETNNKPGEKFRIQDLSYHNGKMIMLYEDSAEKYWVKEFICKKAGFLTPTFEATLVAEGSIMDGLSPGYAKESGPFEGGL